MEVPFTEMRRSGEGRPSFWVKTRHEISVMLNLWELESYTEHVRSTGLDELIETIAEVQELGSELSV